MNTQQELERAEKLLARATEENNIRDIIKFTSQVEATKKALDEDAEKRASKVAPSKKVK